MAVRNPWMDLALNTWRLGTEAQSVVTLRLMKMAMGGAGAITEAELMVREKMEAGAKVQQQLAMSAITGQAPHRGPARAVALYRRKVRANQRRLTKR
ncbi:MAG: hypothetical protein ABI655_15890 [Phenylobacterium sp.]